jgi:hypothetical protein
VADAVLAGAVPAAPADRAVLAAAGVVLAGVVPAAPAAAGAVPAARAAIGIVATVSSPTCSRT